MTSIRTRLELPESPVDMSPSAILARLEMVGQLRDLCLFLGSGTIVPIQDQASSDRRGQGLEQSVASCSAEFISARS